MPLSTETYILPINSIDLFPTNKLKPFIVRRYKEKRVVSSSLQSTRYLHIEEIYPSDQWLRVYTDVSKDNRDNTGVGVYSYLFSQDFRVWLNRKNFDAEINAVCTLLAILNYTHNYQNVVILTNSKASMQAVSSYITSTSNALDI